MIYVVPLLLPSPNAMARKHTNDARAIDTLCHSRSSLLTTLAPACPLAFLFIRFSPEPATGRLSSDA